MYKQFFIRQKYMWIYSRDTAGAGLMASGEVYRYDDNGEPIILSDQYIVIFIILY